MAASSSVKAALEEGVDVVPTKPQSDMRSREDKPFWLDAWRDHLAAVKAYSSCVEMSDINGDQDYKLVIADAQRKLKVYSGTCLVSEKALNTVPSAVVSFYMDLEEEVRRPTVGVASGPCIFIYKNLQPFYKFTLPNVELASIDVETWVNLKLGKVTAEQAYQLLDEAKDQGALLSTRTIDFLSRDTEAARLTFVEERKNVPLVQHSVITTLAVLLKDKEDETAVGCLVIGTETGLVLILDKQGKSIVKKIQLPSTPATMLTAGLLDVEYRIIVACRNGRIYSIKNGTLQTNVIEPDAIPVALARYENLLAVGTMGQSLHYYHLKGKRHSTLYMPNPITNMCSMSSDSLKVSKAVIVALSSGEIRVYAGKSLINKSQVHDTVTAMKFGRYGREDATLVLVLKSGTILLRMLPRTASLEANSAVTQGPPEEQDVPLKVPKRTTLYVEQTEREKQFGVDMHRVFQRDLCKLRLNTARSYVRMLTNGQGTQSHNSQYSLRLTAHVQGLGPLFKIRLNVQNTGAKSVMGIPVVFLYNQTLYKIAQPYVWMACLVPSLIYTFEVGVECVNDQASNEAIKVVVVNPASSYPILSAIVNMPIADMLMPQ